MGKTTLINDLLTNLKAQRSIARLDSMHMEPGELLHMVTLSFGLDVAARNTTAILQGMREFLVKQMEVDRSAVLIVDEAQSLSPAALDELRLLSNMQKDGLALLQIFLVGQEKLGDLMLRPGMEQLHQRMLAACHLEPLTVEQTHNYIMHRLKAVGWRNDPELKDDIYPEIYNFSLGIPRPINLICSRLLLNGCMSEKHELDASDVQQTIEHLDIEKLTPFADQSLAVQKESENIRVESPVDQVSNVACSNSIANENLNITSIEPVNLPVAVLSKHSKETSLWRVTFYSFIAGVAAAVCFVAVFRFLNG